MHLKHFLFLQFSYDYGPSSFRKYIETGYLHVKILDVAISGFHIQFEYFTNYYFNTPDTRSHLVSFFLHRNAFLFGG